MVTGADDLEDRRRAFGEETDAVSDVAAIGEID